MDDTRPGFPFTAIVGQEEMKRALLLNVVHPGIGGVLLLGHRGTAKSTAVRALAGVMPPMETPEGCPLRCSPGAHWCDDGADAVQCLASRAGYRTVRVPVPVVDLPLGSTEDRVVGTLDLEAALLEGRRCFEPGLLARAHRSFLYIDEVNLLEDHIVDLLLDVAASGENLVERESLSVRHPARFVMVGSANPEEGDVRPQLLDRFGLCVAVVTENEVERRLAITRRRLEHDADPAAFTARFQDEEGQLSDRVQEARELLPEVRMDRALLEQAALLNAELEVPGHRGELTLCRAARAAAALDGRCEVVPADMRAVADVSLRHRIPADAAGPDDRARRLRAAVDERLHD